MDARRSPWNIHLNSVILIEATEGSDLVGKNPGLIADASATPHSAALGVAGQLARRVAEKFKLRQEIFLAEIQLEPLYAAIRAAKEARRYEPLPRFPAVERDFSLLLADGTPFSEVVKTIRSLEHQRDYYRLKRRIFSAERMFRRENIRCSCA